MSQKKILICIITPVLLLVLFTATTFGINSITDGYRVGGTKTTITAHGVCKKVTNTGEQNIFIPTNTPSEWSTFLSHIPSSYITLEECAEPPTTVQDFQGAPRASGQDYSIVAKTATLKWPIPWTTPDRWGNVYNNEKNTGYNVYRSTSINGIYTKINSQIIPSCPTCNPYGSGCNSECTGSNISCVDVIRTGYYCPGRYHYTDTNGLSDGTTYYYKITAVNSAGEGTQSSAISVRTPMVVLNSNSGQTCAQKCSAVGLSCVGIGTDATASNQNEYYDQGANPRCQSFHFYSWTPPGACNQVMKNNPAYVSCSGHKADWTNCSCQ